MLEFFDAVAEFLEAHKTGGEDAYAIRLRLTPALRTQPGWDDVEIAWDQAAPSLHALVDGLNRLSQALEEIAAADAGDWEIPRLRVSGALRQLGEVESQLQHMIAEPEANGIYWLESERNSGLLTLNSVPLKVGPLIRKQIFDKNRSVIMTSATLRVAGTFDYMRERLEATDADELTVGSPFDYGSAALLYLVTDVPEPGQPGHQKAVERTLQSLFQATQGRGMALFTAYSQLQTTAQAITGPLSRQQITVYTQGMGSSRAQLLENFRRGNRAVLLGTRSFWEGVDVVGEALSCLAIVKLPFDVPNDPIVAARAETYDDSFNAYMVPEAILRFMQGFGRLIRSRTDRGVVVVLDRRLVTKAYGKRFLESLPGPAVRRGTAESLPAMAAKWLAGEPLPPAEPEAPRPRVPVFEEPPW
jgi:DNA polymerase-3 subunit epsilon/ATP-dependent DNA helicase DinG